MLPLPEVWLASVSITITRRRLARVKISSITRARARRRSPSFRIFRANCSPAGEEFRASSEEILPAVLFNSRLANENVRVYRLFDITVFTRNSSVPEVSVEMLDTQFEAIPRDVRINR